MGAIGPTVFTPSLTYSSGMLNHNAFTKGISTRRAFLRAAGFGSFGLSLSATLAADKDNAAADGQKPNQAEDVSPEEDLMREHGILKRVLLIYRESLRRLDANQDLKPELLAQSAGIIRSFIEDYHEKLEENQLFPRFEKAGKLVDLVTTLRQQHQAGRRLTDITLRLATAGPMKDPATRRELTQSLQQFIRMYEPHEAREDTNLFPAFHKIVTPHEHDALGDEFEAQEHKLFGQDGFEMMVDKVAGIEKDLGIYDLNQLTPKI